MIGVKMRNEDAINGVIGKIGGFKTAADGIAAINQERNLAQAVEEGGVIAIGARPAVTNAKTF
jgi:hypothetical protein